MSPRRGRPAFEGIRYRVRLNADEIAAINTFSAMCRQADGVDHALHEARECSALLQYSGETLIGVATLQPGTPLEACILVSPALSRRGVGRRLCEAAHAEARRRDTDLLITANPKSAFAEAFSTAVGAVYEFSEYRMELRTRPAEVASPVELAIRDATTDDAATFAAIQSLAFDQLLAIRPVEAGMRAGHHRYCLGILNGAPIATIRIGLGEGPIYITSFAVLPEYQGRGYGRQLLTRAIQALEPVGRSIMIEVATKNQNALHLYESCGFEICTTFAYFRLPV